MYTPSEHSIREYTAKLVPSHKKQSLDDALCFTFEQQWRGNDMMVNDASHLMLK
jgi:hypothetical protein